MRSNSLLWNGGRRWGGGQVYLLAPLWAAERLALHGEAWSPPRGRAGARVGEGGSQEREELGQEGTRRRPSRPLPRARGQEEARLSPAA